MQSPGRNTAAQCGWRGDNAGQQRARYEEGTGNKRNGKMTNWRDEGDKYFKGHLKKSQKQYSSIVTNSSSISVLLKLFGPQTTVRNTLHTTPVQHAYVIT